MSFFVQFPHAFAKAAQASDEGDKAFQACLAEFVKSCIFPDVEQAGKAFEAAREQAAAALLATQRTEALEAGQKALKGITFSKTLSAKLLASLSAATVLDPETGEPNPVSIVLTAETPEDADDDAKPVLVVKMLGRLPSTRKGRSGGGGKGRKAYIDGEKVNAALLKGKLADTYAGRVYADAHKADPERYGAKTNLNATQAVKADPDLSKRIEWRDE